MLDYTTQHHDKVEAKAFLDIILPHGANKYCVSEVITRPEYKWRDRPVASFDEIVNTAFTASNCGHNSYIALSGFAQGWHKRLNNLGHEKNYFRTQENSYCQRSLWLDIDAGKEKTLYKSNQEALEALVAFFTKVGIPCPIIVSSGLGLHVYWSFTQCITTADFSVLSGLLRKLTIAYGLDVDHSRTTDSASVLRLPGTMNYGKDGIERKVELVTKPGHPAFASHDMLEFAQKLLAAAGPNPLEGVLQPQTSQPQAQKLMIDAPKEVVDSFGDFMTGFQDTTPRLSERIFKECAQIKAAGRGTYTQWYNAMLVLKHCADGEQAVHVMSSQDTERYNYQNTQTKYTQALEGGCGPCRCETFNDKDPNICSSCPYWGKITTPLQLGDKQRIVEPILMPAPEIESEACIHIVDSSSPMMEFTPYTSSQFSVVPGKGIVYHKKELISGEIEDPDALDQVGEDAKYITKDILICDVELYIYGLYVDNTGRDPIRRYVVRKKPQGRAAEDILFDVETAFGTHNYPKWMAQCGILPRKAEYNKLMAMLMHAYLASVQNKLPEIVTREHFGWVKHQDKVKDETYEGFVIGDRMYSQHGTAPVILCDRAHDLSLPYHKKGTLEDWKHIPDMYKHLDQPIGQLMMCTAFGAPFMRFGVGAAFNVIYNIWEESGGKGKTNMLRSIGSVWGDPDALLMLKNDTHAARYQHFSVYQNLPILIDEITNMVPEQAADLLYDVASGKEKKRSTPSGTGLAKSGEWQTITSCSSNRSLYELMKQHNQQINATCMRVIEWKCDFKDYTGTPYAEYINIILNTTRNNYGHAGPAFMEYIFKDINVIEELKVYAQDFQTKYSQAADERFWMYGLAIPLFAGRLAVRAGLLSYDMDALEDWCVNVLLPTMRSKVKTVKPTGGNLLADYFNENLRNTLIVRGERRERDEKDPGLRSDMDTYVVQYPQNSLYIRHELDTNTYYFSTTHFSNWCKKNNLSMDVVLQDLERDGLMSRNAKAQRDLGAQVSVLAKTRSTVFYARLRKEETT